ncbi:MAG: hypothetical protein ACT4OO_12815 [Nitrospiraceae bacterium]
MLAYQIFFAMFAISIPVVTLVVAGRHLWIMTQSILAQKFLLGFLSFLAAAALAGLFVAVGAVWFGYGVAHSKKDLSTDLIVILVTAVPSMVPLTDFGALHAIFKEGRKVPPPSLKRCQLDRTPLVNLPVSITCRISHSFC